MQLNFKLIANLVHFQGQLTISFRLIFVEVNVTDPFIGNSIIYPEHGIPTILYHTIIVLLCNPGGVDVPVLGSLLGALLCSLECLLPTPNRRIISNNQDPDSARPPIEIDPINHLQSTPYYPLP